MSFVSMEMLLTGYVGSFAVKLFKLLCRIVRACRLATLYKKLANVEIVRMEELVPQALGRVLVLAPHPDDESIGCGGLIAALGENVEVLCLTDGALGIAGKKSREVVEIRKKEFAAAMSVLNVQHWKMLNAADGALCLAEDFFLAIDFDNYNTIIAPNPFDCHPDHQAVLPMLGQMAQQGKIPLFQKILLYEVWNTLALPNRFFDLDMLDKKKQEAISQYTSQVSSIDYGKKISALNEYRGLAVGKEKVEAYVEMTLKDIMASYV